MGPLSLDQLAAIVEGTLAGPPAPPGATVHHVAVNSGRVSGGSIFFAMPGARTDGHRFVGAAAANGAVAAVVSAGALAGSVAEVPLVVVEDTLVALQRLAGWWRRQLRGLVVAVVGSNGKTITKDCLVHLLGYEGRLFGAKVYGSPGSYNSQLGVPLALLECPLEAAVAVMEVAVSDPGEMARQAHMLAPDYVVLTNVGTRWRNRFADRSHQVYEMLAIAGNLPAHGWVLSGDGSADVLEAAAAHGRALAQRQSADLPSYGPAAHGPDGARFETFFPGGETVLATVRTASDEILADVQLAVSAAWLLGSQPASLAAALQDYTPTATRMEIWRSPVGITLVRDVATPDPLAVSSALRTARRLAGHDGRTLVVLAQPTPGWESAAVGLAGALSSEGADEICAVAAAPHARTAAALAELDHGGNLRLFADEQELRSHLLATLRPGDVCLVQSPPGVAIGELARLVIESMSATRLYIDLAAVQDNLLTFRRLLGPSVKVMAMVKALAYGTEPVSISLALQELGADALGVSSADEGLALRRAGVTLPILVLLGTANDLDKMVRSRLTPLVYSPEMLAAVKAKAAAGAPGFKVHLEVDTGFHRAGLQPAEAIEALTELAGTDGVEVEGLMTHLASPDDPAEDEYTERQLDRFELVARAAGRLGLDVVRHAAASAAAIRVPRARYDMVRLGLGLHGLHLSEATAKLVELTPAMALVSRLVQVIEVAEGERVGYGGIYTVPEQGARLGVVPAGYHDCVPRAFSNFGYVMIAGKRCPIVGRVSMDSMTVDVSGCPEAVVGSDVLIYGRRGDWEVPLEEVSAAIGTNAHEVMARLGPRVQRIFTRH